MKLAILGSSPIALEAAHRFHLHGAAISLFNFAEDGEATETNKILDTLRLEQMVKPYPVIAITKRFVAPDESIPGKSRFYDLFRVIYQVDPKNFIQEQKLKDPALYQKLSSEMEASLQSTLEMFEDFDVVLDFRQPTLPLSMAATGRALGEGRTYKKVHTGTEAQKLAGTFTNDSSVRELALIGSTGYAVEVLMKLEEWLEDERNRLFLITTENEPFAHFMKEGDQALIKKLASLLDKMDAYHETAVNEFMKKLREWQELDDFVQVKIPKPAEPIPRLNFFSGHNVTAVDELIDRERLFLTLEKPDFRDGKKHPENNLVELKTIGVDRILVAQGMKRPIVTEHLREDEQGYFSHLPTPTFSGNYWEKDLAALKGIEDEIFKLFSPAGTH